MRQLSARACGLGAVAIIVVASGHLAAGAPLGTDYANPICAAVNGVYPCDDPAPSIAALIHGDLAGFFANQPPMGAFSILLRAPFAALGQSQISMYRLGAFPCLLALGLAGLLVALAMERHGRSRLAQAIVLTAFVVNPLTAKALYFGHPEELLAAALTIAALLLAIRDRPGLGGAAFGVALATKGWALLALAPVAIAATPGQRRRLTAFATAAAAVFVIPMAAGNPHVFEIATRSISAIATRPGTVTPANAWWPFAHWGVARWFLTANGRQTPFVEPGYALPAALGQLTHPLIIALVAGVSVVYGRRVRVRDPEHLLTLLALIMLIRCEFDPFTFSYHHAPFWLALLAAEGIKRRRLPLLAALSAAVLYFLSHAALSPAQLNAVYLTWALALTVVLSAAAFAPGALEALRGRKPKLAAEAAG